MKRKAKRFKFGLKQIIIEVLTGLLTTFVLTLLSSQGWIPANIRLFINIFLIIGNILLIKKMWSWGVFYTIGWIIGSIIFFEFGIFGIWEVLLYIILPVAALLARIIVAVKRSLTA